MVIRDMMQVFSAVFYFLCGCVLTLAVFTAMLMLLYIANATIDDLFGVNLIDCLLERIKRCQKQEDSSMK